MNPPAPSPLADVAARLDGILLAIIACVADARLRAMGVPWPFRWIAARLMRRKLERMRAEFAAAFARIAAGTEPSVAGAGASEVGPEEEWPGPESAGERKLRQRQASGTRLTVMRPASPEEQEPGSEEAAADIAPKMEQPVIRPPRRLSLTPVAGVGPAPAQPIQQWTPPIGWRDLLERQRCRMAGWDEQPSLAHIVTMCYQTRPVTPG